MEREELQFSLVTTKSNFTFIFSYNLPCSLPGIVRDMSGSFWSGQEVEYDLILHLALLISATIIVTGMGPSTILSESHGCGPNFFSPEAIRKVIFFVWFWWEREKPAAEVPSCKHKQAR